MTLCKSNTWRIITTDFIHNLEPAKLIISDPATIVALQLPYIIVIRIISAARTVKVNKWPRIWAFTHNGSTVINDF